MVPRAAYVVMAKDTQQVSDVLKFLNENKQNVVPRTGGSSVTRGVEPQEGGVILDGSDMTGIINIDEVNMQVTARCGMPLECKSSGLPPFGPTTGNLTLCSFAQAIALSSS